MKALQEEREEKLIKILTDRLEPFVKGQTDDFVESAELEAQRLSQAGTIFFLIDFIFRKAMMKH